MESKKVMIYKQHNVEQGCQVLHVPTCQILPECTCIDIVRKRVTLASLPVRAVNDKIVTYEMSFTRLEIIAGPSGRPALFMLDPLEELGTIVKELDAAI
jgi:hypothetical protein